MAVTDDIRPCERQCRTCGNWKHHSRFRSRRVHKDPGVRVYFDLDCLGGYDHLAEALQAVAACWASVSPPTSRDDQ